MELLRYVLPYLAAGCLSGLVAAGGIIATNLGSLRDLMQQSPDGLLAGALMTFGFVVTFGSAAIGGAIMQIGQAGDSAGLPARPRLARRPN